MALLANQGGGFLFEKLPHLFPEQCFTELEATLWALYYENKSRDKK